MRRHRVLFTAACGALMGSAAADASFVGMNLVATQHDLEGYGLATTWRTYAVLDNSTDTVEAVFGEDDHPLAVASYSEFSNRFGPAFFQHLAGGLTEPFAPVVALFPDVVHDSFLTIGNLVTDGTDATSTAGISQGATNGPNVWGPTLLHVTNGAWYRTPGDPLTHTTLVEPGHWHVLVGQFTIERGHPLGARLNFAGSVNGFQAAIFDVEFAMGDGGALPPLPEPAACLGLALGGLVGSGRRRRRQERGKRHPNFASTGFLRRLRPARSGSPERRRFRR